MAVGVGWGGGSGNGEGVLSVVKTFHKYLFVVFGSFPTMVSANPALSTWFSLLLLDGDMLERERTFESRPSWGLVT